MKGLGVATFDAQEKDVGAVGDASHFEAGVGLKRADDFPGCGDSLAVTLGEALEEMERDGSEGPHVAESVAETTAADVPVTDPPAGAEMPAGAELLAATDPPCSSWMAAIS